MRQEGIEPQAIVEPQTCSHKRDEDKQVEERRAYQLITGVSYSTCEPCLLSKMAKSHFDEQIEGATLVLEIIKTNI